MTFSLATKDAVPEALRPACRHISKLANHTAPKTVQSISVTD